MKILIVDDDIVIRTILRRHLSSWEYEVVEAADGLIAWDILQKERISIVLTDWMMPGLDGPGLCRRIREVSGDRYIYVILLTARNNKEDLVEGMESGADDFVEKPFIKEEIRVRIKAGERILALEQDLEEKNRELQVSYEKLHGAYEVISQDLEAAARIQRSLIPEKADTVLGYRFDWLFCPSSFVAGDTFNIFRLDEGHLCFYLLDVAGHGIPAALLSTTLSRVLSPYQQGGLLKRISPDGKGYLIASPLEVVRELNNRFESKGEMVEYFTIVYGVIDTVNHKVVLTQAGHPSPLYLPAEGGYREIGDGGFPVGMIPDIDYEERELVMAPGERLIIYSDGITECMDREERNYFSLTGLTSSIEAGRGQPLRELIECLEKTLVAYKGSREFMDDISLLAIERVE
jgi:sigma-B regulation protein RsbU (phosphoserine phosphatase)